MASAMLDSLGGVGGFAAGAAAGTLATLGLMAALRWRRKSVAGASRKVFELGGLYYELLGYSWDHQVKDFRVLYRPLYDCAAKKGSYEAHSLATSTFERWSSKFTEVPASVHLPNEVVARLKRTPAPPALEAATAPARVPGAWPGEAGATKSFTASGHGTRSFEGLTLEGIIGDYKTFIDVLLEHIRHSHVDVFRLEMDHICLRCESTEEYLMICEALCPAFGEMMTETNIGGRPIATIKLATPLAYRHYSIACIEVPCPKPGSPYPSGLEHAEFVIGTAADGMHGKEKLLDFVAAHPDTKFDTRAIDKELNADVSLSFDSGEAFGRISVKFHQRPLYEVVAYELRSEKK